MITFLSSPKAFSGPADIIQRNAILSWKKTHPRAEVIIYGDSVGTANVCHELEVQHVPDIQCSPSGVPYFNGIVEHARLHARYDIQVYLNSDILMSPMVISLPGQIGFSSFLIVGQRLDLSEGICVDMAEAGWQNELAQLAQTNGVELHGPSGTDYFIFTRGLWKGLSPLVIGRAGYDGALLAYCLRKNVPIIDATYSLPALHQFHGYGHVVGAVKEVFLGEDATNNKTLHGIKHSAPLISDSTWRLNEGRLLADPARGDYVRRLELYVRFNKRWETSALLIRGIWRFFDFLGLIRSRAGSLHEILRSYSEIGRS